MAALLLCLTMFSYNRERFYVTVSPGSGTAWVVIQLVLTAITAALEDSIATDGDATGVRALFNLSLVLDMLGALPIAATVLAVSVGLRRTRSRSGSAGAVSVSRCS